MPVTDRTQDTRARLVDVAARLLREHGAGSVTTRRVAQDAGVQPPTLYRLFGDKDGLLDAVAEHVMATYVTAKAAVVGSAVQDGLDPVEDLRSGWDAQVDFGLANPTLFVLLSSPDRGARSPAARAGLQVLADRVHRVATSGRLKVSEQRAVELIHAAGTGVVLTLLASPPEVRDRGLADAMLRAVLEDILLEPRQRTDGPSAGPVVALRATAPDLDALSEGEQTLLVEWLDRVLQHR